MFQQVFFVSVTQKMTQDPASHPRYFVLLLCGFSALLNFWMLECLRALWQVLLFALSPLESYSIPWFYGTSKCICYQIDIFSTNFHFQKLSISKFKKYGIFLKFISKTIKLNPISSFFPTQNSVFSKYIKMV